MTYLLSFCDRCQEETDRNRLHAVQLLENPGDWLEYELCDDCYKALKRWLDSQGEQ